MPKTMFRSIADIARSEGEDIQSIETCLACLEVFALGGSSDKDNAAESGYYAVRALMAKQVSEAAKYIVEKGIAEEGGAALVCLIAVIASRFGSIFTHEKMIGILGIQNMTEIKVIKTREESSCFTPPFVRQYFLTDKSGFFYTSCQ